MHDQPRHKPYARSDFFDDQRSARGLVPDTVARGHLREAAVLFTGKVGNEFVDRLPLPVSEALVRRGRERYDIYCSPCHGLLGLGDGMIVQRGYRRPPSLHVDRLRQAKDGYFFDVVTNGFGAMPDYAAQIRVDDRWAIVAWLRVLQLSQGAPLSDVPPDRRATLGASPVPGRP